MEILPEVQVSSNVLLEVQYW